MVCLPARLLSLPGLSLGNTHEPVQTNCRSDVEDAEYPHKPEIAPPIVEVEVHIRQKGVGVGHATETAAAGAVVEKIPSILRDVLFDVLSTSHFAWCLKLDEFAGLAGNRGIGERCADEAFHYVGERVDAIHKYPEPWKFIRSGKNTDMTLLGHSERRMDQPEWYIPRKSEHDVEEEIQESTGDLLRLNASNEHVSKCTGESEEYPEV